MFQVALKEINIGIKEKNEMLRRGKMMKFICYEY